MDYYFAKQHLQGFSNRDIRTLAFFYNLSNLPYDDLLWSLAIKIHTNPQFKASMPIDCKNVTDLIDDEEQDIPASKFIKLHNGICWNIDNLALYIINNTHGKNEYTPNMSMKNAQGVIVNLAGRKIYESDDLETLYEKLRGTELYTRLYQTLNPNIVEITPEMMELIKRVGAIMQARGPIFKEYIRKNWSSELIREWLQKVPTQTTQEPPQKMSDTLQNQLNNDKAMQLADLYGKYIKWPENVQTGLSQLYSSLTAENLAACVNGEYCMKEISTHLLEAYNKWAKITGAEEYPYKIRTDYSDMKTVVNGYLIEPRANLGRATLKGVDLRWVDLRGANLIGADLQGADLTWANLTGASFYKANLQNTTLLEANLQNADLEGAKLEGVDLRGTDLRGANLQNADFGKDDKRAKLDEAVIDTTTRGLS